MPQYGYGHGEGAPEHCGYTGSSGFNYQSNTMPYLVQECLGATITESGNMCGTDMATACGPNALKMVTALGGSNCECVRDPQAHEEVAETFGKYNAVWRPGTEGEIQVYGWTYKDYRAKYDELWPQGWRLYTLIVY